MEKLKRFQASAKYSEADGTTRVWVPIFYALSLEDALMQADERADEFVKAHGGELEPPSVVGLRD